MKEILFAVGLGVVKITIGKNTSGDEFDSCISIEKGLSQKSLRYFGKIEFNKSETPYIENTSMAIADVIKMMYKDSYMEYRVLTA
jgi:hypothetical protein